MDKLIAIYILASTIQYTVVREILRDKMSKFETLILIQLSNIFGFLLNYFLLHYVL